LATEDADGLGLAAIDIVAEPEPEPVAPEPLDPEAMLDNASLHLANAIDELSEALRSRSVLAGASSSERQSFAKYLTLAKIKLENAIAVVRSGDRMAG
jgi:hypothetical protein